jgi:tetratricopeptide (TPR) repeat protein
LLVVSIIHAKADSFPQQTRVVRNPLVENLNEFDEVFAQNQFSLPLSRLDAILSNAEGNAVSVNDHLSVLKRRRILAKSVSEYQLQYQNAVARILEKFPYSEQISIIAGEALLLNKNELNENDKIALSQYIKNISIRNPIVLLGFYLFEGQARNLATAKQIPQAAEMYAAAIDHVGKAEQPIIAMDTVILQILADNKSGVINLINKYKTSLLEQAHSAWFMAEVLYDFDDPSAAVSFLGIEDYPYVNDQSIIRLADSLYRIGDIHDARFFWNMFMIPENAQGAVPDASQKASQEAAQNAIHEKALYNLASTSQTDEEKKLYLEELFSITPNHVDGRIMYSRLLNHAEAVTFLNQTMTESKEPRIELELITQNRSFSTPGKTAADIWLLLNRYPANQELYQWASYFFEEMRMYDEADQLEKNAGYNFIDGEWLALQKALQAMRTGEFAQAENLLQNISSESSIESALKNAWEVSANLGLIKETQLSFDEAIKYYERALSLCGSNKDQALIQLNMARCFSAVGNSGEARRVLQYAQELDPDNLRVRLELRKLQ